MDVWLIKTNSTGHEEWNVTFNSSGRDYGHSVEQTSDDGYIIAGYTGPRAGEFDVWLIKTDSSGNKLWDKTFGGAGDNRGHSVEQTSDGGYIITGRTGSDGLGTANVWLIKTDSNGNEQWNKTFGGSYDDYGNSVQQTSDGGYIIAGFRDSYGRERDGDVWLIKTDSSGKELWNKAFASSGWGRGNSVEQTSDGGYIIAGETDVYGAAGRNNVWLIKTDSSGKELWNKAFGSSGWARGNSVQQTSDGGYIIAGETRRKYGAGGYSQDVWLIKTDSNGNELWNKTFGNWESMDYGSSVQQTSDGGYIIAGFAASSGDYPDVRLIKLKPISPEGENGAGGLPFWICIAIGIGVAGVLTVGIMMWQRLAGR